MESVFFFVFFFHSLHLILQRFTATQMPRLPLTFLSSTQTKSPGLRLDLEDDLENTSCRGKTKNKSSHSGSFTQSKVITFCCCEILALVQDEIKNNIIIYVLFFQLFSPNSFIP